MDIVTLLTNAMGADTNKRQQAQAVLEDAEQKQTDQYLVALCGVVSNSQNNPHIRVNAALQVKNALNAQTDRGQEVKNARYLSISSDMRGQIKQQLLQSLHDMGADRVRRAAAQAVAKIGSIEIPENMWPELLNTLASSARSDQYQDPVKTSVLECIGYLCEQLDEDAVQPAHVNDILTAIIHNMRVEAAGTVRLAATTALGQSLSFTGSNMAVQQEANMIVTQICTAAQCGMNPESWTPLANAGETEERVRKAAFECMVRLASFFYPNLKNYVTTFFQMSVNAITKDANDVQLQAIEFWNTICDAEYDLLYDGKPCENYINGAVQHLVPLLCQKMCDIEEDDDDDEWVPSKAAAVCIELMAKNLKDDILQHVMPIVNQWIGDSTDWKKRDAAAFAFSALMEESSLEKMSPIVKQAITPLMSLATGDQSAKVRDTSLYCIAKICGTKFEALDPACYDQLLETILKLLPQSPSLASHAILALHNIASNQMDYSDQQTNILTKYYQHVLSGLLNIASSDEPDNINLRLEAHEAINMWISSGAYDTLPLLKHVATEIINRLKKTLQMPGGPVKEGKLESLTGSMTNILQKVGDKGAGICDQVVEAWMAVLGQTHPVAEAECFMLFSAVANCSEANFIRYMGVITPHLLKALGDAENYNVCCMAINLVCDISRAIGAQLMTDGLCDKIVESLLKLLQNEDLDRSVKPPVLGAFGDIGFGIGNNVTRYLGPVMSMMTQASQAAYDPNDCDEDTIDFFMEMRESILDGYATMLQGLTDNGGSPQPFLQYLNNIFTFFNLIAKDANSTLKCFVNVSALIGDIVSFFPNETKQVAQDQNTAQLVNYIFKKCTDGGNDLDETEKESVQYGIEQWNTLSQ